MTWPSRRSNARYGGDGIVSAAKVIRLHSDPWVLFYRASALDESPDTWDLAERLYIEAVSLDPSLALAMTNIGNIVYRRDGAKPALDWYQLAIAADPDQPEANHNAGHCYLDLHCQHEALAYFEHAVVCDPSFADAWYNLAIAREWTGYPELAAQAFTRYLASTDDPNGRFANLARGHIERSRRV